MTIDLAKIESDGHQRFPVGTPMTDDEIRLQCAVHFFDLEGVTEAREIVSGYFGKDVTFTWIRREDRVIVLCPDERHIGKRYPDPLNNDMDACAVLDRRGYYTVEERDVKYPRPLQITCATMWKGERPYGYVVQARLTDEQEPDRGKRRRRCICLAALETVAEEEE